MCSPFLFSSAFPSPSIITSLQMAANISKKVSASIAAVVSLIRRVKGKKDTAQGSYSPSGDLTIGRRFNSNRKKGPRDRWHGFTDVFSTHATATIVSSQPRSAAAHISNDELELLEDSIVETTGPQSFGYERHARSSDQEAYYGPQANHVPPFYTVYTGRTT